MNPRPAVALLVLLAAFLLFLVQPIAGRSLLPWLGGVPAVWTACLLFFQTMLLAGYAYAHASAAWMDIRRQAALHSTLAAISLLFLPLPSGASLWHTNTAAHPTWQVFVLLLANTGAPYFILSATAPLAQRWFAAESGRSPYRLYALSNAGSLLALAAYPFLIEPFVPLRLQARSWTVMYAAFALLSVFVALRVSHRAAREDGVLRAESPVSVFAVAQWLALSAVGAALLMSVTAQMSQEIASTPFLWILPLILYLGTFIIAFEREGGYRRGQVIAAVAVLVPAACVVEAAGAGVPLILQIAVYGAALFAGCLGCHGELAASKPEPERLTAFYLAVAAGGALGGFVVAVIAPVVFRGLAEFELSLAACCGVLLRRSARELRGRARLALATAAAVALAAIVAADGRRIIAQGRNFFGVLRVVENSDINGPRRVLEHGRVTHGFQYTSPERRLWPTSYFAPPTGAGIAFQSLLPAGARRVGVIGLGAGTLAAYGRPGDTTIFYEVNPAVADFAGRYFTYLRDSGANVRIITGDARVEMERQAARGELQQFHMLVVDAFTGGAIPVHLLTAECMGLYRRHLAPGGVLAFHISNRWLDLAPVVRGLAASAGWQAVRIYSPAVPATGTLESTWMLVTSDSFALNQAAVRTAAAPDDVSRARLWTDDSTSLWHVLKF